MAVCQSWDLMGFADVAPKADKELYVAYCYKRQLFEKVVGDTELLRLTWRWGASVRDIHCREAVGQIQGRGCQDRVQTANSKAAASGR